MKEIIYNYDNMNEDEVNNVIKRAKAVIINSNDEILLGYADKTYQCIGGHVEDGEDECTCLMREIKEESGINLKIKNIKPFLVIKYYSRNYPVEGLNTVTINNYFIIRTELKPNVDDNKLTDYEKEWGYTVKYIPKDKVLARLRRSMHLAKKKNTVLDTVEAISEFIRITDNKITRVEWK